MERRLPVRDEMVRALERRDTGYEGIFVTAVRTTGVFCRPGCPARTPKAENVEFFATAREALAAGYRPCRRCRPLEPVGGVPAWIEPLLERVETAPAERLTDADIGGMGLDPVRVRRWFKRHHGMTFHAYARARRLGVALGRLRRGADPARTAYAHGFESLSGFRDAFRRTFGTTPGRSADVEPIRLGRIDTPLGSMVAGALDGRVCLLEFADRRMLETQLERLMGRLRRPVVPGPSPALVDLEHELLAYFEGRCTGFEVDLALPATPFQRRVWRRLLEIPYAETRTYAELARAVGRPGAARAVGRAIGDNRLAILVPCHRVVGSDGRLTGYGGGVWRKRWLLEHERATREASRVTRTAGGILRDSGPVAGLPTRGASPYAGQKLGTAPDEVRKAERPPE